MSIAYVDTSVLTAISFDEPGAATFARRFREFVGVYRNEDRPTGRRHELAGDSPSLSPPAG